MTTQVEEAIYRLRAEGQQQLDQLKKSIDEVVVAEERLGNVTRVTEQSLQNRLARLDPQIKAQEAYKRELESARRFAEAGIGTEAQRNAQIALATQRYREHIGVINQVKVANDNLTNSTKPARYELINLSRQLQDVFVSLAGGQSFGTVAVQQGTQIADTFAASEASIKSFATSSIGWLGRFITSTTGGVAAVVALGGSALYFANQWNEAEVSVTRSLAGIGKQSGATTKDLVKIAETTSETSKIAKSSALEAAAAFAGTGKIGLPEIERLTAKVHDFAKVLGLDVPEAVKLMAESFAEAGKGVDELGKRFSITAGQTENIKRLQAQGNFAGSQNALTDAILPALGRANESSSTLSKTWDGIVKFAKDFGASIGQGLDRSFGNNSFTDKIKQAQKELERLQAFAANAGPTFAGGERLQQQITAATRSLEGMKIAAQDAASTEITAKFVDMGNKAAAFGEKFAPAITQINAMNDTLHLLSATLANPEALAGLSGDQVQQLKEARDQLQLMTGDAERLRQTYGNIPLENAKFLDGLRQQLPIVTAVTGQQAIQAQYQVTISTHASRNQSIAEATLQAELQRAAAVGQVNAQVEQQTKAMEDQVRVINARKTGTEASVKAEIAYENAIRAGASGAKAASLEEATYAAETAQASERATRSAEQRASATARAADAAEREAAAIKQYWEVTKFLPFSNAGDVMPLDLKRKDDGTFSQFDPAGYTSTIRTPLGQQADMLYDGHAEFVPAFPGWPTAGLYGSLKPSAQGYETFVDKLLSGGLGGGAVSLSGAIDKLLSGGGMLTGFGANRGIDQAKAQTLSTLTDLIPDDQKIGVIQRQLEQLRQSPETIARDQLIKSLTDQLKQLQEATENNTDAINAQLDPLFSQGHEYLNSLRIGYYKAASGFDGVARGGTPGVDSIPFHAMVQDGERITITPRGSSVNNNNSRNVTQNITQNISMETGPVSPLTARQMAQGFIAGAARAAA